MPKDIQYTWDANDAQSAFAEPEVTYLVRRPDVAPAEFEVISNYLGISQTEWADILHISDRTLQRYLKEGKSFTGSHAEVLFYLQKLVQAAQQLFASPAQFLQWLRQPKQVLGQPLGFNALQSVSGIKLLHNELGRMAYGVYI